MKVLKITAKNLKLLMRSKTSLLVVIFGPLLIMLLVGFAFNNPSASKINIGYYAPEKTELTDSFIKALDENPNFALVTYTSEQSCIEMIEQSKVHICVVFPADFRIQNNKTNEMIFYVDQSRANFVYSVIDTVSSKVDLTSSQLSYKMTSDLITAIDHTKKANSDNVLRIIKLKASATQISDKLSAINTKLNSMDLSKTNAGSSSSAESSLTTIETDLKNLKDKGLDAVEAGEDFAGEIDDYFDPARSSNATALKSAFTGSNTSTLNKIDVAIVSAANKTTNDLESLETVIDSMSTAVDELNEKVENAKETATESAATIAKLQQDLSSVKSDLDSLKATIETTNNEFNNIKVTSAESIVNPIQTTIKPINTKANNLNFVFPYLIVLIIVFISIMLSSTTIIMEKTSRAYFRNFATPTKDITFITSIFLTSMFVVILQLVFILALAYYFLNTTILSNVALTLLLIFASITLFTLLGMIIGYMFNSQEAVTMAAISVGSVLLFLSNLILPLETMSVYVQEAAKYNPYVLCSELLKKITLFGSDWNATSMDFAMIGGYIVVAFILVLIVQKMSKIQYISKKPITKQVVKKDDIIDKYFKLKSGVLLRNEKDLLEELKKMSDETFDEYVDKKKNDFESWLMINQQNTLAKKVGSAKDRKEMILVLEKESKK